MAILTRIFLFPYRVLSGTLPWFCHGHLKSRRSPMSLEICAPNEIYFSYILLVPLNNFALCTCLDCITSTSYSYLSKQQNYNDELCNEEQKSLHCTALLTVHKIKLWIQKKIKMITLWTYEERNFSNLILI